MRHFSFIQAVPFAAALALLAGCATPVESEFKAGTQFSQYRTFALMPLPQKAAADDPGAMLRLAEPARAAVVGELTAKGLTQALPEQADLAVNLKGRAMPKIEVTNYGYTYPVMTRYGTYSVVRNPYTDVTTTTERTLIIELLDNRAKELVWVGWMKKDSSGKVTPEVLQDAIRKILAKYPPDTTK